MTVFPLHPSASVSTEGGTCRSPTWRRPGSHQRFTGGIFHGLSVIPIISPHHKIIPLRHTSSSTIWIDFVRNCPKVLLRSLLDILLSGMFYSFFFFIRRVTQHHSRSSKLSSEYRQCGRVSDPSHGPFWQMWWSPLLLLTYKTVERIAWAINDVSRYGCRSVELWGISQLILLQRANEVLSNLILHRLAVSLGISFTYHSLHKELLDLQFIQTIRVTFIIYLDRMNAGFLLNLWCIV